jgi:glucan-binding YG repeat protein
MLDGVYEGVYYHDGLKIPYFGLVQWEGDYYYVADYAQVVCGRDKYVSNTNDLTYSNGAPIQKGIYSFDEQGRMILREGLIDGVYYENNTPQPYKGLVEIDGSFYYINDGGKPIAGRSYFITNTNGLTWANGVEIKKATYEFDADGKMVIRDGFIDGVYYENNVVTPYKGLIEYEGNFYYINDHGKPVVGKTYFITKTNDLTYADGVAITKGAYEFDADGKMIIKDGLVNGVYYEKNKVVAYKGLIEVDGAYYYINDNGKPVTDRSYYVAKTNGLVWQDGQTPIEKGTYTFDAEGKLIRS